MGDINKNRSSSIYNINWDYCVSHDLMIERLIMYDDYAARTLIIISIIDQLIVWIWPLNRTISPWLIPLMAMMLVSQY